MFIPANAPFWDVTDFLFGVRWYDNWYGNYDEKKYKSYQFFSSFPFVDAEVENSIANGKTKSYLERYGMDYSDIVDPSSLYNAGNTSRTIHQLNWVGNNISRLYR